MRLSCEVHGSGRSVAFVHGFTQTRRSWAPLLRQLDTPMEVCTIDAPGHGDSTDGSRSVAQAGDDIAETMSRGTLVGYSMGARMSLHAALQHPRHVTGLVLISGTPGIEDPQARADRRSADEALALRLETEGLEAFIDRWLALPMFAGLSPETDQRADRLTNVAVRLAESLRHAGVGTQVDVWDRLDSLTMPVLLIAGANDSKFTNTARRMHERIPQSTLVILDDVGHTAHLEDPIRCAASMDEWLSTAQRHAHGE